jgi:hypothetical protein
MAQPDRFGEAEEQYLQALVVLHGLSGPGLRLGLRTG